jgi:hypothetical protein
MADGCPRPAHRRSAAAAPSTWLIGLVAGKDAVMGATQSRGASNTKARRAFGWTLRYPSWRQGFVAVCVSAATDHVDRHMERSPVTNR